MNTLLQTSRQAQPSIAETNLAGSADPLTDLSDPQALSSLAQFLGMRSLSAMELHRHSPDFSVVPLLEAGRRGVAVFRDADGPIAILTNPSDSRNRQWLALQLQRAGPAAARWGLCARGDLDAVLRKHEESVSAFQAIDSTGSVQAGEAADKAIAISLRGIDEDASMVVKLVNSTIYDALKAQASDIHLESKANALSIRYRVDGVLATIREVEGQQTASEVISRLKVMSELDIAERRIPQDGRFKVLAQGRNIDFRVSIMPSIHGEDAVLRVLDRYQLSSDKGITLESLGFVKSDIEFIRQMSAKPYGLLLVTGPTGSGKTTTMYAALTEIHTGLDKIVTIEDPVEYQLSGVLQIPVNEAKGLTFARGLRSILRHDPDKIMVGEIRDPETAQIAVQAALTGHQVFTTVHANNVFDVLGRFSNMGVDAYSFVSALNGILAQRLVRVNCAACSVQSAPQLELLVNSGLEPQSVSSWNFRRGMGCALCRGSGYRGRRAIAEKLPLTDEIRDLIAGHAPMSQIKQAAAAVGVRSLRQAALSLVERGDSTLEEINRVSMVE